MRLIDADAEVMKREKLCEEKNCEYLKYRYQAMCKGCSIYEEIEAFDSAEEVEAEPVRHGKGCEYCKGRSYTKKPLTVITRTMKRVEVCFNFCPNCGRDMRVTDTNVGGKGGNG